MLRPVDVEGDPRKMGVRRWRILTVENCCGADRGFYDSCSAQHGWKRTIFMRNAEFKAHVPNMLLAVDANVDNLYDGVVSEKPST